MPLLRDVSRVALRNVRAVEGTGAPAKENHTLIIEDGRIVAVGSTKEVAVPDRMKTVDLDGRTVLPGFVMLHEHTHNLEHAIGPCTRFTKANFGTEPTSPTAQSLMRLFIERNVVLTFYAVHPQSFRCPAISWNCWIHLGGSGMNSDRRQTNRRRKRGCRSNSHSRSLE